MLYVTTNEIAKVLCHCWSKLYGVSTDMSASLLGVSKKEFQEKTIRNKGELPVSFLSALGDLFGSDMRVAGGVIEDVVDRFLTMDVLVIQTGEASREDQLVNQDIIEHLILEALGCSGAYATTTDYSSTPGNAPGYRYWNPVLGKDGGSSGD